MINKNDAYTFIVNNSSYHKSFFPNSPAVVSPHLYPATMCWKLQFTQDIFKEPLHPNTWLCDAFINKGLCRQQNCCRYEYVYKMSMKTQFGDDRRNAMQPPTDSSEYAQQAANGTLDLILLNRSQDELFRRQD